MKIAEDIWRGSIAARTNMLAAANYSAAFYGNAALQSWQLGLTAPLSFWQAIARAVDGPVANDVATDRVALGNVVEMQPAPVTDAVVATPVAKAAPVKAPAAKKAPKAKKPAVVKPALVADAPVDAPAVKVAPVVKKAPKVKKPAMVKPVLVADTPVEAPVAKAAPVTASTAVKAPKAKIPAVVKSAPVTEPVAELAPVVAPNPALLDAPRDGQGDDLQTVRGVGAKLAASLNEIGIYHFDQLASLDAEAIDWLDENIAGFKRSCARYDIVAGAASLL